MPPVGQQEVTRLVSDHLRQNQGCQRLHRPGPPVPESDKVPAWPDSLETYATDGELLYVRFPRVWSVRIEETATNLQILGREQLPLVLPDDAYDHDYDPVHDRFLVVRRVNGSQSPRIHVVVNWVEEISARMSARE